MKVKHELKRGYRINCSSQSVYNKDGRKVRVPIYEFLEAEVIDLWWCEELNKWTKLDDIVRTLSFSSHKHGVHSVRAAVRHIKKHDEIPKGTKFRLSGFFVGCDVVITK